MAAPKGNQFWKARSSHGAKPKFEKASDLWDACEEYFVWVEENPLITYETVKFQGEGSIMPVPRMRAMTITAMCRFLDVTFETWTTWRKREDLSEIVTRAETVIRDQKFEGAAADLLNSNIIARDLGLTEKKDITSDGEPIAGIVISYDE